jgi:hypothetical protein
MAKDEELAYDLLHGTFEPYRPTKNSRRDGVSEITSVRFALGFLKPGSPEENAARSALARILRGNPTPELLHALADVMEPGSGRLAFKRPRPSNRYQDMCVALAIYSYRKGGDTVRAAKEKVAEEFGIGDETVRRIWRQRKKLLK